MVRYDTQAAYRGAASRTDLIHATGRMSGKSDPRRPKALNEEEQASVRQLPDLMRLHEARKSIHKTLRLRFKNIEQAAEDPIGKEYNKANRAI